MSQQPLSGHYLCFDYGTVRIGVAVGNSQLGTATPLIAVKNNSGTPDWSAIDQAINEWKPVGLVVGIPLTENAEVQEMTHLARGFRKRLAKRTEVPVFDADESFTSVQAQQELKKMRANGQRGRTQKADVDTLAAALILERWFSSKFSPSTT